MIEKKSRYSKLFSDQHIHAPVRLKAIPKGDINSALHLSKIRVAWNNMYDSLDELSRRGLINNQAAIKAISKYAEKTDDFISAVFDKIDEMATTLGRTPTKDEIKDIAQNWLDENNWDDILKECLTDGIQNSK
ncbi:hypothetical protein OO013_00775 [Mangrovivirga sp. M17]|uniref:Uncharacterized protein n=1 Tax=Mangrovivirga halotolerans TaxID=2993936 RepID=A0ABT3RKL6_9BACT|nr:hypothetical protein [Mangrovivirga halotolerans]MCX2742373.1 hypothetical protein [Mangrovivirga halotolerans]